METLTLIPYDITYFMKEGKAVIAIYGRTIEEEQICVIDENFSPYFYIIGNCEVNDIMTFSVGGAKVLSVEKLGKKIFEHERQFLKITVDSPASVPKLREEIKTIKGVEEVYEADILFTRRYLIDKQITPMEAIRITGEYKEGKFSVNKVGFADQKTTLPKVLAFDIEVYNPDGKEVTPQKHPILMIALYGQEFAKVLTWKKFQTNDNKIEFLSNEADMIMRFCELIKEQKPDILTGYYSDGFDLPYIATRAKKKNITLQLGIDGSEPKISGRQIKEASITGIVHLDIFQYVRHVIARSLQTDTYKLDAVAEELLGEKKHQVPIEDLAKIWDLRPEELQQFCDYNLQDARLTYMLVQKLMPSLTELVKTIRLPLFDVSRMSFSQLVEWFLIREAYAANEIAPNKPNEEEQKKRIKSRAQGAFVYEPTPGFYQNIVVFDYRSLYPTIIASHNISIGTESCTCCTEPKRVPEHNYWYCTKQKGFISRIIEDLINKRLEIKKQLKKDPENRILQARSEGLKVLANSFYGYLGFAPARWYSLNCVDATTAYARHYVKLVMTEAEKKEFRVLYGDTDSAMLLLGQKTKDEALEFAKEINEKLPGIMELDLEGFYKTGIFVSRKDKEKGAKKKYALADEKGNLKIRGFETVRRNTAKIARTVQETVLKKILREQKPDEALSYVQEVITKARNNKLPVSDMIIETQLQKEITAYSSIGPHVVAAQRMKEQEKPVGPGSIIRFVVVKGKGLIRDKVRLPEEIQSTEYDSEYYISNHIIPAVDSILAVFGFNLQEQKQDSLSKFF